MASTLRNNLIAWYACDEANASDNFVDSHTGGLTLTQNGSPGVVTGGRTFVTAGADRGTIDSTAFNPGTGDFSVAVRFSATLAVSSTITGKGGHGSGATIAPGWRIAISSTGVVTVIFGTGTTQVVTNSSAGAVSADTEYLLVVRYDRDGNQTALLDNSSILSGSIAAKAADDCAPPAHLSLGSNSRNDNLALFAQHFTGTIFQAAYWSRHLTADECTEVYNSGSELAYPPASTFIPSICVVA